MNRFISLLIVLTNAVVVTAEPQPLLVIREMNPWQMVIGSESASFVIYDNGEIIYQRFQPTVDQPFAHRTVKDSQAEAQRLLGFDVAKLKGNYSLSLATDQVRTIIWTPAKKIEIYGNWRKPPAHEVVDDPEWIAVEARERKMWESLPSQIRQALERIEDERKKEGRPWLPANVEVMLWSYENAPEESIVWPAAWPGLKSDTTQKRGKDSYSVYLPAELLPDLRKFLASQSENGAVLIDGKKMSASYRIPFVGEHLWMQ